MKWEQKRDVMSEVGEIGLVLLECYYSRAGLKSDHNDSSVAKMIGWNKRKVQKYRLILTKAGLFKQVRGTGKDVDFCKTILGKKHWSTDEKFIDKAKDTWLNK